MEQDKQKQVISAVLGTFEGAIVSKDETEIVRCPYCEEPAKLVTGGVVYPNNESLASLFFWRCAPCKAWVGVHQGTTKPLGRLADEKLREWKRRAHVMFDPLWKRKMARDGCSKHEARNAGYKWLAQKMGISREKCHIGEFNVGQCRHAVAICEDISKGGTK